MGAMERDFAAAYASVNSFASNLLSDTQLKSYVEFPWLLRHGCKVNVIGIINFIDGWAIARTKEFIFHLLADDFIVTANFFEEK